MWKIQKIFMYKITDENTGEDIATGLEENQAQAICNKYNETFHRQKWSKESTKKNE